MLALQLQMLAEFRQEISIMKRLRHPHIVQFVSCAGILARGLVAWEQHSWLASLAAVLGRPATLSPCPLPCSWEL